MGFARAQGNTLPGGYGTAQGSSSEGFSPSQGNEGAAFFYAGSPFSWTEGVAITTATVTKIDAGIDAFAFVGSGPTGISINSGTGALTGTPTVDADTTFTVRGTNTTSGAVYYSVVGYTVAWSPLTLGTDLLAWFKSEGPFWKDSARTVPATANNDPVGAWDDSSGNDHHALQATDAVRPLLAVAVRNGKNGVFFSDGTSPFPSTYLLISAVTYGRFAFCAASVLTSSGFYYQHGDIGDGGSDYAYRHGYAGYVRRGESPTDLKSSYEFPGGGEIGNLDGPHAYSESYDGTHAGHIGYVDGIDSTVHGQLVGFPTEHTDDPGNDTFAGDINIGRETNGTHYNLGHFLELFWASRALTPTEIVKAHRYLNTKFALYGDYGDHYFDPSYFDPGYFV